MSVWLRASLVVVALGVASCITETEDPAGGFMVGTVRAAYCSEGSVVSTAELVLYVQNIAGDEARDARIVVTFWATPADSGRREEEIVCSVTQDIGDFEPDEARQVSVLCASESGCPQSYFYNFENVSGGGDLGDMPY